MEKFQTTPEFVDEKAEKKINKAEEHRKAHGYSRTMAKLMEKYKCSIEAYRLLRRKHQKEGNVGPRRVKQQK